jgi:hypothetical protein
MGSKNAVITPVKYVRRTVSEAPCDVRRCGKSI